jgi:glutathione synthase/RimK-type ligase-like ATP-grasp enzyme
LTRPKDLHAVAVAEALARRGARAILWDTSDFPTRARESMWFERGQRRLQLDAPGFALDDDDTIDVVWHRRPKLHAIDRDVIDPRDHDFVELGCAAYRRGLFDGLARDAFWVNDYVASLRAESKPLQLRAAQEVGLDVPDTLYSNDPDAIRDFLARHGGACVFKPVAGLNWQEGEQLFGNYTSIVRADDLVDDDLLQAVPGVFQEHVPKAFELRLTMFGQHALTAKVRSQETRDGRIDWRRAYDELTMEPFAAPPHLVAQCHALLQRLGLVFGCFDFVVTPDGRFVFLEVNQMGQWLFVERYTGLPLLDGFTEMLLAGAPEFAWSAEAPRVRYDDVGAEAYRRVEAHAGIEPM